MRINVLDLSIFYNLYISEKYIFTNTYRFVADDVTVIYDVTAN